MIKKLGAVIAVKAEYGKGEKHFYILNLFKNTCFSFPPNSPLFSPAGGNIHEINGIDIYSGDGLAAMSNRIGFEKAWA